MRATRTTQPSQKRKRSSILITELDGSMELTQTCPPSLSASSAPSRLKRRQKLKEQQINNKSITSTIKSTADRNQEAQLSDFQAGNCSHDQQYPTQYYISPNHEGPENSLTVREAECASDSDTD